MDKKQYVYIGQYWHINGKDLPLDYKFGVTDNLDAREYALGRTKSPIKYMILKAWELPSNVKREKVEKLIELVFDDSKYGGCEWYDVDGDIFQEKIAKLFEILSSMVTDSEFEFVEVKLKSDDVAETQTEREIVEGLRNGTRGAVRGLFCEIDGKQITGETARSVFTEAVSEVVSRVGTSNVADDFPLLFKPSISDFAEYRHSHLEEIGGHYLDTRSDTGQKVRALEKMFRIYGIPGAASVVSK